MQGTVEEALRRITRMPDAGSLRLTVAGRTDAGVHATHQVCHVDVPDQTLGQCVGHMNLTPVQALQTRLSRMMPDDIAIHGISVAPAGFDARFSALERTYVYRIADARVPWDPRLKDFAWRTDRELDIAQMNAAAALTLGLHDFGSFAIANPGGTTIREVKTAYLQRVPTRPLLGPGMGERYHTPAVESGLLCFTIVADAFARNMVRLWVPACRWAWANGMWIGSPARCVCRCARDPLGRSRPRGSRSNTSPIRPTTSSPRVRNESVPSARSSEC